VSEVLEEVLPISGLVLQWQLDSDRWRVLPDRLDEADAGWFPWSGEVNAVIRADGDVWNRPSWLVLWGESQAGPPTVLLTDGTPLPVVALGRLWATEWVGQGEPVTMQFGDGYPTTVRIALPEGQRTTR
jgi:hypothetical protein